jgi:hypothetical protein
MVFILSHLLAQSFTVLFLRLAPELATSKRLLKQRAVPVGVCQHVGMVKSHFSLSPDGMPDARMLARL